MSLVLVLGLATLIALIASEDIMYRFPFTGQIGPRIARQFMDRFHREGRLTARGPSRQANRSKPLTFESLESRMLLSVSPTSGVREFLASSGDEGSTGGDSGAFSGMGAYPGDVDMAAGLTGVGEEVELPRLDMDALEADPMGSGAVLPQLPTLIGDTPFVLPTSGVTRYVAQGDNLQAVFDVAQPGDVIVLEAGATFVGNFVIRQGSGGEDWIYVISGNLEQLPGEGVRVSPADAGNMAKLICPNQFNPTLIIEPEVHNFRFVGIEITTAYTLRTGVQYGLVRVGWLESGLTQKDPAENIIFDRCYIHGTAEGNIRDGIVTYNVSRLSIINSYLDDIHGVGYEAHGIQVFASAGPVKISNNYIEAAGINVFIGDDVVVEGLIPRDVEVTGNHFYKPWSWKIGHEEYAGINWLIKNLFEIKDANRVLVQDNIMENNWTHAQNGVGILLTPIGGDVEDVTFRRNILKGSDSGMTINPTAQQPRYMHRVLVEDNLFYLFNSRESGSNGGIGLASTPGHLNDVIIRHNTIETYSPGTTYATGLSFYGSDQDPDQIDRIEVTDNIFICRWGIGGTSKSHGYVSASYYSTNYLYQNNTLVGDNLSWYADREPPDDGWKDWFTHSPENLSAVGLTNDNMTEVEHFRLSTDSPYYQAGTDGKDIGADIDLLPGMGGVVPELPGVQITETNGNTAVSEDGATDQYAVTLRSQPTANVTITVTTNEQLQVVPSVLTFTPQNWNVPQTVTVAAVDDDLDEDDVHTAVIMHAATSDDPAYDGIAIGTITVSITDNDVTRLFPGDANADGVVDAADMLIVSMNWGRVNATWSDGDFNGDERVDAMDAALISMNWGKRLAASEANESEATEPAETACFGNFPSLNTKQSSLKLIARRLGESFASNVRGGLRGV